MPWAPLHVQVCTLSQVLDDASVHICKYTLRVQGVHVRSYMCSLFVSIRGPWWGDPARLSRAPVASVWGYFWQKERCIVCDTVCLVYFRRGLECMCVYVCIRTHTNNACRILGGEPSDQDETPGGPEKSRWTQVESRHICIRICVQSTHVYAYAGRQDYIWNNSFFSLIMIFLPKKKSKDPIPY